MDHQAKLQLDTIITDINTIIKNLNNVSQELSQFKGIGSEYCAQRLNRIASDYQKLKTNLMQLK
ncbi:hypothetical protein LCL95_04135 [Bacillus timonensis]|nr:hypothetical protein [Bacillus timonensis]